MSRALFHSTATPQRSPTSSTDHCALCGGAHKRSACPWGVGLVSPFLLQRLVEWLDCKYSIPQHRSWAAVMAVLLLLVVLGSSVNPLDGV